MSSWFSSGAFETLSHLKDKVQSTVGIDPNLIQKITLQSPDLAAERARIDSEERRKESVRDSLAELLPWETRDPEMEILVDECKEAILSLSGIEETFTGPFILTGGLPSGDASEEDGEDDEDLRAAKDIQEAEKSADKLSKLQPLPALLGDFDLDTHVGLIQRLFEVDPKLVKMHSRLSSGGKRELAFWKNYFFHCAYARYEAGLSIDEIWSNREETSKVALTKEKNEVVHSLVQATVSDEEIIFDDGLTSNEHKSRKSENVSPVQQGAFERTDETSMTKETKIHSTDQLKSDVASSSDSFVESTRGTDYEFVANVNDIEGDQLDELEAEIAAALGD
ncbi:hypothetical protein HJC23_009650 [Cyclotella cryptica]|uniref:BSD domain-containing protein n=1 Tax=Cyclotella cryptica TaxID=29204 RepID=A0ABD3PYA6_9STRA|eukprot:CCRYP_010933-RA/>CCRYP_010933-RA protein AED:0.00 eAED:0.00 QI:139/-1/1/1/-1/1/1/488/336